MPSLIPPRHTPTLRSEIGFAGELQLRAVPRASSWLLDIGPRGIVQPLSHLNTIPGKTLSVRLDSPHERA
jgi:hypothetical protein